MPYLKSNLILKRLIITIRIPLSAYSHILETFFFEHYTHLAPYGLTSVIFELMFG